MAGTSPSPQQPNRVGTPRPHDDPRKLAEALIREDLGRGSGKPDPGRGAGRAQGSGGPSGPPSNEDVGKSSRWRKVWDALKQLLQRSRRPDSPSPGPGGDEPNPWMPRGQAPGRAASPGPSSQPRQERSEARQALDGLSPAQVEMVTDHVLRLIQERPELQKAYADGRLPVLDTLLDKSAPENRPESRAGRSSPQGPPSPGERWSRGASSQGDTATKGRISQPGSSPRQEAIRTSATSGAGRRADYLSAADLRELSERTQTMRDMQSQVRQSQQFLSAQRGSAQASGLSTPGSGSSAVWPASMSQASRPTRPAGRAGR